MKLIQISPTHIDTAWREGASALAKACARTNEMTGDQLKLMLSRDELQLLCAVDDKPRGWAAVKVERLPNYRALLVCAIHAPGAVLLEELKQYAAFNGCVAIRGACDDSVSRLWRRAGAVKKYQIMEWVI